MRTLRTPLIATLALAIISVMLVAGAAFGKASKKYFVLTGTGAAQQVTPSPARTIYARVVTLQNHPANSDPVYVGNDNTVSATNCMYALDPGMSVTFVMSPYLSDRNEEWKLDDYWILATLNEEVLVTYELQEED